MSYEVSVAEVQQYRNNVVHLSQQKGSRLRNAVRTQPDIVGLNYYFERIGATGTQTKTSRHSPTPLISTPQSRRRVSMFTESWGEMVDSDDKLKLLIDPESEYVIAGKNAFGRTTDDYIIDGALNSAFGDADGGTAISFPAGQVVPDSPLDNLTSLDSGTNDSGQMSPQRMLAIMALLDAADVDPDEERYIAYSAVSKQALLSHVPTTSSDYNTVRTLVEGGIDTYGGFKWIMSNRLPLGGSTGFGPFFRSYASFPQNGGSGTWATDRICIAWAKGGLGFALQEDVKTEIGKDPSHRFSTRIYMEMVMGATRIEEAPVIAVPCQLS